MPLDLTPLDGEPRLLIEATLQARPGAADSNPPGSPISATRSTSRRKGHGRIVLVESAQSMANRLEAVCWTMRTPTTGSCRSRDFRS